MWAAPCENSGYARRPSYAGPRQSQRLGRQQRTVYTPYVVHAIHVCARRVEPISAIRAYRHTSHSPAPRQMEVSGLRRRAETATLPPRSPHRPRSGRAREGIGRTGSGCHDPSTATQHGHRTARLYGVWHCITWIGAAARARQRGRARRHFARRGCMQHGAGAGRAWGGARGAPACRRSLGARRAPSRCTRGWSALSAAAPGRSQRQFLVVSKIGRCS